MFISNEQFILQNIYSSEAITRSELTQNMNLSQASVIRLVTDLIEKGYIIEKEADTTTSGRGRPSGVLSINPACGTAIGVELGRDNLIITFLSADGTVIHTADVESTPEFKPDSETIDQLLEIVFREASRINLSLEKIIAFGLAVHDLVSSDGEWLTWNHAFDPPFPVQRYLESRLRCLIHVEDVSRAFAFAEHRYGSGRGASDMIYLFVGRHGIGSGIFVNNMLLKSSLGICGEIGHITVADDGKLCQCGNYGCLETVATYSAIEMRVRERLEAGVVSSLSQHDKINFADICQAYEQGDKEARIGLSQLALDLGKALASTINIVGATHILIGGQLRLAGQDFVDELANVLRKQLIPGLAHRITVGFAELQPYAGSWGMASRVLDLAWQTGSVLQPV